MILLTAAAKPVAHAQTYTVLYNYSPGTKAGDPSSPQYTGIIAQGQDGNLFSTTPAGGTLCSFCGVLIKMTPSGTLTHVFDFNYPNAAPYSPFSGLTLGKDGNFYGTTEAGGNFNLGTVFKSSASGNLTKVYDFGTCKYPCKEGAYPKAPPVQGRDGNFYGTTPHSTDGTDNGIVYKITPTGKYTPIYAFDGVSGGNPNDPLTLGTDGNFYGTTAKGGKTIQNCAPNNATCGTVFKITPAGRVIFLYKFDQTHGAAPLGPLVQASDGNFYGTTSAGGDSHGDGVIFKITPQGKFTLLYALNGSVDGKQPSAGLAQVTDGKGNTIALYGATQAGGSKGYGTLFKVSLSGGFTRLYDFDNTTGRTPEITLLQDTTGTLYGETFEGGSDGAGVFYSLDDKLPAFVSLVPTSGKVGDPVEILGQGFHGTTAVSFNGKAATFKVVSGTYLTATVPTGASKGLVTVKTPSGTLTSNQVFIVTPFIKSFSPTSGKVGTPVVITGTTFTGTTKVTFGGVPATTFKVDSDTQVTADVPTGAVTGKITITTPSGTAVSAGVFTVTQ
ncbi:MAG TPA: choice-of-anchor tandem repeat GloVer-containing protein [Terriglobales bacterium]|nr:choice-of-anchor tandem repeat GloVer-containing protein [Terriglobales bacterium]